MLGPLRRRRDALFVFHMIFRLLDNETFPNGQKAAEAFSLPVMRRLVVGVLSSAFGTAVGILDRDSLDR